MKILLAEKDKTLGDILYMLLESFKYSVVRAKTADDVLLLIKKEAPDLILIDRNLQGKDGLEISKIIKEDFLTAYIPIIILINHRQMRKDLLKIDQGIDDYIVNPPDPIDLQIRIEMAVRRAAHQFFANALTRLPGNRTIEIVLKKVIESKAKFSFGYIDIDRFKYFNDRYGYLKGDKVIIQTAHIITHAVKEYGNKTDFVGHIGGDDFVFVTTPDREEKIANEIIREFDRLIICHYSKDDQKKGHIQIKDRQGKLSKVPLMNISIALINNLNVDVNSLIELSEIAFEIKGHLKTQSGSKFLKNRRGQNKGLTSREKSEHGPKIKDKEDNNIDLIIKIPLGQLLIESNLIKEEVLDEALIKHWQTGQNLGQTLISMGLVSEEDILKMLKLQENKQKS